MVMQRLGHKKIETTMLYTQLLALAEDPEYASKGVTTAKEAMQLVDAGFEYVNTIEGINIYRKRK
jgi:hypothetical protein